MSKIKELVSKETQELAAHLGKVLENIEQIMKLREHRESVDGIEQTELDRLTDLCESYLDDINILLKNISYLSQTRREGKLYLADNGQYRMEGVEIELKEGYPLEILLENIEKGEPTWQIGRIMHDHATNVYYFIGEGSKRYQLEPGILAAIRLEAIRALEDAASAKRACKGHHVH